MAMLNGLIQKLNGEDEDPAAPSKPGFAGLAGKTAAQGASSGHGIDLEGLARTTMQQGAGAAAQQAADMMRSRGPGSPSHPNSGIAGGLAPFSAPALDAGGPLQDAPQAAPAAPQASPFKFSQQSVSEILQRYPPTPAGLEQAFKENPQLSESGSRISTLKSGKIFDPTTGRDVDVGLAFGSGGGKGWAWQTGDDAPAARGADGGGMGLAPLLQADPSTNIQSALSQFGASQDDGFLARLIAQLRGGQ
jgi:hypothetical protein